MDQTKPNATPDVIHRYLFNGMEVYLERADLAALSSLQVWVKTGSIDEEESEAGMAHLLEHMLFKGTPTHPAPGEIASIVESEGGEINAFTRFDHTVYLMTIPSHFTFGGAELLMDVLKNSLLDAGEMEREREVVLEEVRRMRDQPGALMSLNLFRDMYKETRLERPVIGHESTIRSFSAEDLRNFYRRWYIPNNMVFVASGNFEPAELFAKLERLAQDFAPRAVPVRYRPRPSWTPGASQEPGIFMERGPYQEARVQFACRAPSLEDRETPAWDMFSSLLGHGDSSRLARAVQEEKQLVTSIDSGVFSPKYPWGLFSISFYARAENAVKALQEAIHEVGLLAANGPSKEEMIRVLNSVKAEKIYSKESVEGIANNAGFSLQTTQKMRFDEEYLTLLSLVTAQDVRDKAAEVMAAIKAGQFTISTAIAKNAAPEINESTLKQSVMVSRQDSERMKLVEQGMPALIIKDSEVNAAVKQTVLPLPGNKELHINFRGSSRLPLTSCMIAARGGLMSEPAGKHGLNGLTAQMLTRGTSRQTYKSFVEELEDRASSIGAFSARDFFGLRMEALEENSMRTLEMMLDSLFRPALLLDHWEKVVRETHETIVAHRDSPIARLEQISGPLLFPNHPYSVPGLGTEESLAALTYDDLPQQWMRLFAPRVFVLSLAGKFDLDAVARLAHDEFSAHFSELEKLRAQTGEVAPALVMGEPQRPSASSDRIGFSEFEREQAHITVSFRAVPLTDPRRTALELAATILGGQGGRLFMDLRDARSLAYSVGASNSPQYLAGSFLTYIATSASKAQEATEGLKYHIEQLAREEVSEAEMLRARRTLIGGRNIDAQHYHYQASQLSMSDLYDLGFDNFLRFEERLHSVTPHNIREVIAQLLAENPPIISIVGPKGTWVPTPSDGVTRWSI